MASEHSLRPDLVFFTGDLAFGEIAEDSLTDQYVDVEKFLDSVRECFTPVLQKTQVFLVPGNHDVNRNKILVSNQAFWEGQGTLPILEKTLEVTVFDSR